MALELRDADDWLAVDRLFVLQPADLHEHRAEAGKVQNIFNGQKRDTCHGSRGTFVPLGGGHLPGHPAPKSVTVADDVLWSGVQLCCNLEDRGILEEVFSHLDPVASHVTPP
jgi:hypothetical protein